MSDKAIQEKYYEYQVIEEQTKAVSKQIQELADKLLELEYLKISLDEFSELKKGTGILAPISSGIFVKANA